MSLLTRKLLLLEKKLQMEENLFKLGVAQNSYNYELKNNVTNILNQIRIN